MKAKVVPALRSKRGLRRASAAEPQVVGLTPQTTKKRRASTMKTYILRTPKTVEPQTAARSRAMQPSAVDHSLRRCTRRCSSRSEALTVAVDFSPRNHGSKPRVASATADEGDPAHSIVADATPLLGHPDTVG